MGECVKRECYYYNSSEFIDDVLDYFQEDDGVRGNEFEEWKKDRTPNLPLDQTARKPGQ